MAESFLLLRPEDTFPAWRAELEIVFILKGSGALSLEGADRIYRLQEGDIFAINQFSLRTLRLEQGALAISLLLGADFIVAESPETQNHTVECKSFLHGNKAQGPFNILRTDFALAFRAQYKNESPLPIHLRGKMVCLLDHLLYYFSSSEPQKQTNSGRERLRTAVEYIQCNYRENITLGDLMKHTYLSGPYLSRSFQKYLGISFTGYLTQVRLMHALTLLQGESTVTDVAYACGFPGANAFIDAFKHAYGTTPGAYRTQQKECEASLPSDQFDTEEGFSAAFISLMKYADDSAPKADPPINIAREVALDANSVGQPFEQGFRTVINAGYARDLLNGSVQEQVKQVQEHAAFGYIRCKGILDDDMVLYCPDMYGNITLNFVYLDEVVDFILDLHAKPMLEFGHMPYALAKDTALKMQRAACICAPADFSAWRQLIHDVVEHLMKKYGVQELRQWLFSPWMSIDFCSMEAFTREEYWMTYQASYEELKGADSGLRLCGPGANIGIYTHVEWFLKQCKKEDCLPDILTFRSFSIERPEETAGTMSLQINNEAFAYAVSGDENYLKSERKDIARLCEKENLSHLPVLIDEWSNNVWQRDLCNDTCFKSAYIFKNILECSRGYYGLGYFNITDQLDEIAPASESFHGGFGLFTRSGLPKSAFRAMELLSRAGTGLLHREDGCLVTATKDEIQIFLYHYSHYDMLYRYRHTINLTKTQRYKVFNEKPPCTWHLHINNLEKGGHTIRRYSIGPEGGSVFDEWVAMGAPEPITHEIYEVLHRLSYPVFKTETLWGGEEASLKAYLLPHEVQLITISK